MKYLKLAIITLILTLMAPSYAQEISLREKIGQMIIIGFPGKQIDATSAVVKAIEEDNIGGVILFDYNPQEKNFNRNIESEAQVKKLNTDLQYFTYLSNEKKHRPQRPLLIGIDYEGGFITRLKERYGFPKTLSANDMAQKSLTKVESLIRKMAETLHYFGFNLNFSPLLDVNSNPDNPIIGKLGRSFSNDPMKVVTYASLYSKQFLKHGIQCAYKHFPGHGSSATDSHLGFVDVTESWREEELYPYEVLLNEPQHCDMIMTAHIVNRQLDNSGLPATLSHKMITDILREKLQFKGVVITDDMQMKAISQHYGLAQAVTLAINAGVDMFIFGNQLTDKTQHPKRIIDMIEAKVNSGEISIQRINEAYQHVMNLKARLIH